MKGLAFSGLISGALLLMAGGPAFAADTSPAPAATAASGSADARLQALYNREWTWRQQELGRGDRSDDD